MQKKEKFYWMVKKIAWMKNKIGYLPQYPNFFSWMTAFETLSFMGTLSGLSKK